MKKILPFIKKAYTPLLFLLVIFLGCFAYLFGVTNNVLKTVNKDKIQVTYIDDFDNIKALAEKIEVAPVDDGNVFTVVKGKWDTLTSKVSNSSMADWAQDPFLKLNALTCKFLNMSHIPGASFVKLDGNNITSLINDTAFSQDKKICDVNLNYLSSFAEMVKKDGVSVTYFNLPNKNYSYVNSLPMGINSKSIVNINTYVSQGLEKRGIPCMNILTDADGEALNNLFYKTDHHWKSNCGIYAAEKISEYLNENYGYKIDTSVYDIKNYNEIVYKNSHFGSYGTTATNAYIGAEDFSVYIPKKDSSYKFSIPTKNIDLHGNFDIMLNKDRFKTGEIDNAYAGYIYANSAFVRIQNQSIEDNHKILIIKDSFANVVVPYLAQTIGQIDILDIRSEQADYYKESVLDLIKENGYEQVLFMATMPFDMKPLFVK